MRFSNSRLAKPVGCLFCRWERSLAAIYAHDDRRERVRQGLDDQIAVLVLNLRLNGRERVAWRTRTLLFSGNEAAH